MERGDVLLDQVSVRCGTHLGIFNGVRMALIADDPGLISHGIIPKVSVLQTTEAEDINPLF